MAERFPNIDWYCDNCNSYLNEQDNFDDHKYTWKCTNCDFKSSISRDNIREEE
ncbi:Sec23/Sec24 zinc finger-containing protein [Vagococcus fluvialis]|uniref:Sec23/Sec24 zinc finger-containing protein n=1 Tax=Vagococcus fluvialis TaxID=2738 RepID=UPI003B210C9D